MSDALDELAAKAKLKPLDVHQLPADGDGDDGWWELAHAESGEPIALYYEEARAALATVAVNNIQAAVEALETKVCGIDDRHRPIWNCGHQFCSRCKVLLAIERDAKEAQA